MICCLERLLLWRAQALDDELELVLGVLAWGGDKPIAIRKPTIQQIKNSNSITK